jgi:hypothetical protein
MGNRLYIVDYDIPEQPARKRIQFYRDLKQLTQRFPYDYSTLSVLRTTEEVMAWAVYTLAVSHGGTAHFYQAEEISCRDLPL